MTLTRSQVVANPYTFENQGNTTVSKSQISLEKNWIRNTMKWDIFSHIM